MMIAVALPGLVAATAYTGETLLADSGPELENWMFGGWTLLAVMLPLPLLVETADATTYRRLIQDTIVVSLALAAAHTAVLVGIFWSPSLL